MKKELSSFKGDFIRNVEYLKIVELKNKTLSYTYSTWQKQDSSRNSSRIRISRMVLYGTYLLDFRIAIKCLLRSHTPLFGFCLNIIEWMLWLAGFGFEIVRSRVTTVEKLRLRPDLIKISGSWNSSMILPVFSNQDQQDTSLMEQVGLLIHSVHWGKMHPVGNHGQSQ